MPGLFDHPRDPRVAVTTCREDFLRAAAEDQYRAIILEKNLPPDFIKQQAWLLHRIWQATKNREARQRTRPMDEVAHLEALEFSYLNTAPYTQEENFSALIKVQEEMESLFRDIKKSDKKVDEPFIVKVGNNLNQPMHPHDLDYINTTFGNLGTGWENEQKERLYVPAGDLFFFKGQFMHCSAPSVFVKDGPRLTLVGD
jgi:hypothetical protein